MKLDTITHENCLLVRVKGELDHHWAGFLRKNLEQALEESLSRHLVLNLGGLTFMDSSGVGVILGRYRRVSEKNGRMALCQVSPSVTKVLEISGVPRIIPFFKSEEEALSRVTGEEPNKRRVK